MYGKFNKNYSRQALTKPSNKGAGFNKELLNQTLTILALSESITPITKIACVDSIPLHHNDYQKSIRSLSNLLKPLNVQ